MTNHVYDRLPLYLVGDLNQSENEQIQNHLEQCSECRNWARKYQKTIEHIQNHIPKTPADEQWDHISARALKQIESEKNARGDLRQNDSSKSQINLTLLLKFMVQPRVLSVAATITLVFAITFYLLAPSENYQNASSMAENYAIHQLTNLPIMESRITENPVLGFQSTDGIVVNTYVIGNIQANAMVYCSNQKKECQQLSVQVHSMVKQYVSDSIYQSKLADSSTGDAFEKLRKLDERLFPLLKDEEKLLYSLGAWSGYFHFSILNNSVNYNLESDNLKKFIKSILQTNLPVGVSKSLERLQVLVGKKSQANVQYLRKLKELNALFM